MKPATTVAVGNIKGDVILTFPVKTDCVQLDPETARQMAESIAKEAYKIRYGVKDVSKSVIADDVRNRLVNRAERIMVGTKDKSTRYKAMAIVDSILAEVSG